MDEIGQGPDKDRQWSASRRWLTTGGIAGLVIVALVLTVTRTNGSHPQAAPAPSTPPVSALPSVPPVSAPAPNLVVAPGTVLLTCDSALQGKLEPNWRAGSLRVGRLWLVAGRSLRYARLGRAAGAGQATSDKTLISRDVEMFVHVDAGPAVILRAAAGTNPYFQFIDGYGFGAEYQTLNGDRGFTFVPCPREASGAGGSIAFYDLGFAVAPGHSAAVEVWTSPSARPMWLTFTAPAKAA
jgi:hypothetical protein